MHVVWLRPSKQIRAPLYSIKQKRQRRWIVIKYGVIYILGFAIFGALLAIREYRYYMSMLLWLNVCHVALAFRDHLTINCSVYQGI